MPASFHPEVREDQTAIAVAALWGPTRSGGRPANSGNLYAPLPTDEDCTDGDDAHHFSRVNSVERLSLFKLWKRGDFTFIPEGNTFLDVWDFVIMTGLVCTAVVLPYDVALYAKEPAELHNLLTLIDALFVCDILLTFNIAYDITTTAHGDVLERAPIKIAKRYMAFPFSDDGNAGWFWWDVLTVVPWDEFGDVKDFLLLRMLRLTRMFRLFRFFKLFKKLQLHFGYTMSIMDTANCIVVTLMPLHWFGCAWAHLAVTTDRNWMGAWLEAHHQDRQVSDCSPLEVYNLAVYWCIATLTSVGYGDVLPQTPLEVMLTSFTMIVLGSLWAWVLAHMVRIMQNTDVFATESQQLMDDLNLLMKHRGLDHGLRQRCRKHLHESFHVHRQRHQQRTVKWLSEGLQGEIAVESGVDKAVSCIWYLRKLEKPVLIDIAQRFTGDIFSPNEYVHIRYAVAVIRKGTAIKRQKLMSVDDVIGEDMILATDSLVDHVSPKSLTFLEVMVLTRRDLVAVCEINPTFDKKMRKAQTKLALRRAFIMEAGYRRRGKASLLTGSATATMKDPAVSTGLTDLRTLGTSTNQHRFTESMARSDAYRGLGSNQENLETILCRLDHLHRWMDQSHGEIAREMSSLSSRVDDLLERAGMPKRRSTFMPRIRC